MKFTFNTVLGPPLQVLAFAAILMVTGDVILAGAAVGILVFLTRR